MKWIARQLILAALGALLTAVSAMALSAPVASGQKLTTSVNTPKTITLMAKDADGDSLTYHVVRSPAHGTLSSGTVPDPTYTPDEKYNGPDSFTFLANDGRANSNTATVSISVNDAPTGTVKINLDQVTEDVTRSRAVRLTLTFDDDGDFPVQMCISNTTKRLIWSKFVPTRSWRLAGGSGIKTVNVWFRDKWGKMSQPASDTILLDTTAPKYGNVEVKAGVSKKLTLSWSGFEDNDPGSGIVGYRAVFQKGGIAPLSCAAGTPVPGYLLEGTKFSPATTLEHTVLANGTPLVNGTTYAYRVCAIDAVGNMSSGATKTGKPVDKTPPTGTVTINGGAAATNSTEATLTLTAVDDGAGPIEMCISYTATCTTWTPFAATSSSTLVAVSGTATVNVWYRDQLGNTSATPNSDTIIVDTTPPTGTVTINGGAAVTNSTLATLTLTAVDDGGGAIQMCISNTETCSNWEVFQATPGWTLAAGIGTTTVNVWYRDQVGNASASPYSDTIVVDTTAPTDGTVTAMPGDTQLTLDWSGFDDTSGSGVTGYRAVYQVGSSAPSSCTVGTLVPGWVSPAATLTHTGLINGTTYAYRVCAIDAAGNISSGATASGQPVLSGCENCHGTYDVNPLLNKQHPGVDGIPGTADDSPNVMKYWDGSWWDSNRGGSNSKQQGGHGDPDHFAARQCVDCHDISLPNPSTHLDGIYNSIWCDSSGTRNQNTSHLKASFIGGTTPVYSVQTTLDAACWSCHHTVGVGEMWHKLENGVPAQGTVQFGTHLSQINGDTLPLPIPNDQSWTGSYPVDQDISTNASGSTYYAPCISCHDPHGTGAPAKATGAYSNYMLRDSWVVPSTLCKVCHQ